MERTSVGFPQRRAAALAALASGEADRSRKGGVDAPLQPLLAELNASGRWYSCSSCSGRLTLFADATAAERAGGRKGGAWLVNAHAPVPAREILSAVAAYDGPEGVPLVLRFEPAIVAVEAESVAAGLAFAGAAFDAGWRESGCKGTRRVVATARSNALAFETLVACGARLVVPEQYVADLVTGATLRFQQNAQRIERLQAALQPLFSAAQSSRPAERGPFSLPLAVPPDAACVARRQECVLQSVARLESKADAMGVPGGPVAQPAGFPPVAASVEDGRSSMTDRSSDARCGTSVLVASKRAAKACKDALKSAGLLDRARRPVALEDEVVLPVTGSEGDMAAVAAVSAALRAGDARLSSGDSGTAHSPSRAQAPTSPPQALRAAVEAELKSAQLPLQLADRAPRRWELLGDVALLPAGSFEGDEWDTLRTDRLWASVAHALHAKRLGVQARIDPGEKRQSHARLLWPRGANGWVEHRERGVKYGLDVTRVMFSSGNGTEKARMGSLDATGETVVDLYAGIGYYSLQLLVHAGVAKLYACEWNSDALDALRHNVRVNGVVERCEICPGDNRENAPVGVADRVLLGLLPTSKPGWETAVRALRPTGGILHLHENVRDTEEAEFVAATAKRLASIAGEVRGGKWTVTAKHVERVKRYAPHVRHIVVDYDVKNDSKQEIIRDMRMLAGFASGVLTCALVSLAIPRVRR